MKVTVLFPSLDPYEATYESVDQSLCDDICQKPFNDTNHGCCDLTAKCACSLVDGRHDCVCGPGTYGHSGFLSRCKCKYNMGKRDSKFIEGRHLCQKAVESRSSAFGGIQSKSTQIMFPRQCFNPKINKYLRLYSRYY